MAGALEDDWFHQRRIKPKKQKKEKYPLQKIWEESDSLKEDW